MAAGSGRGARAARARPLYQQLRPRPNGPCEREVAANQRARLCAAMVEAVAEHGYQGASISNVCALAGVSKRTLYQRFAGKEECFVAAYDSIVRSAFARMCEALDRGGPTAGREERPNGSRWGGRERLGAALDALLIEVAEHPKAARLALVDAPAAGAGVRERVKRAEAAFGRALFEGLGQTSSIELSPVIGRGIASGLVLVLQARVICEADEEIAGMGPELLEWLLAYDSRHAQAFRKIASSARPAPPSLPHRSQTRLGALAGDERTRMLYAAARLAAAGGLQSLTSGQIVQAANADPGTFAREFVGVEQCFLAAFELVGAEALARALRESGDAPDWAACVCRVLAALIAQVAGDPGLARVAFAEIFVAGVPGIERRTALMCGFAAFLARRAPRSCRPSPLTAEAIVGSVWGLVGHAALHSRPRELCSLAQYAAYLTLAPIVGSERAVETIRRELAVSSTDYIAPLARVG